MHSNSQGDIIKSARSDKSSIKGEDLKGERIFNILKQSQITDHDQEDDELHYDADD